MSESKPVLTFPADFKWGVATSAYQIEGAVQEDGRGLSIWDTFSHTPGKIYHEQNGDTAVDFYHRYPQDIALMKELGLQVFRFSTSWSRILPTGRKDVNQKGLDFYERLVDTLLVNGIEPYLTLFHWDLPQALQDEGGWSNRSTTEAFANYVALLASRLGDRVKMWITHNEPIVAAMSGHFFGDHAPGLQDLHAALAATHHLLLSHGKAVKVLRELLPATAQVGITLNMNPVHPNSQSEEDLRAAGIYDTILNRTFIEPIMKGHYPQEVMDYLGEAFPPMEANDLKLISQPLDFLGLNYYSRTVIKHDPDFFPIQAGAVNPDTDDYSMMWEIYPPGLYELLTSVHEQYPAMPLYITENGVPVPDDVDADGRVRDERRIRYIHQHLCQAHRAIQDGVPLKGYLHWCFHDNFEWAHGYRMRFGLVFIDFDTQQRIVKDSGRWFAQVIANNSIPAC